MLLPDTACSVRSFVYASDAGVVCRAYIFLNGHGRFQNGLYSLKRTSAMFTGL